MLIGLTGGIASGKSSVARIFNDVNIPVVDADQIARKVVRSGTKANRKIIEHFGDEYFDEHRELDREKMANLIFSNAELNSITHPEIRKEMALQVLRHFLDGYHYIIVDAPLLYETGLDRFMSKVIVVYCDEEQQIERLQLRDHLQIESCRARIAAQTPLSEKRKRATYIIDNTGDKSATAQQVHQLINTLNSSRMYIIFRCIVGAVFILILTFFYLVISQSISWH